MKPASCEAKGIIYSYISVQLVHNCRLLCFDDLPLFLQCLNSGKFTLRPNLFWDVRTYNPFQIVQCMNVSAINKIDDYAEDGGQEDV